MYFYKHVVWAENPSNIIYVISDHHHYFHCWYLVVSVLWIALNSIILALTELIQVLIGVMVLLTCLTRRPIGDYRMSPFWPAKCQYCQKWQNDRQLCLFPQLICVIYNTMLKKASLQIPGSCLLPCLQYDLFNRLT